MVVLLKAISPLGGKLVLDSGINNGAQSIPQPNAQSPMFTPPPPQLPEAPSLTPVAVSLQQAAEIEAVTHKKTIFHHHRQKGTTPISPSRRPPTRPNRAPTYLGWLGVLLPTNIR